MHVQNLSRAGDVSLCVFEAARDVTALKLSPILTKIRRKRNSQAVSFRLAFDHAALRHARSDLVRQIFGRHFVAFSHDHSAIDRVLQLAHIARPVVFDQTFQSGLAERSLR